MIVKELLPLGGHLVVDHISGRLLKAKINITEKKANVEILDSETGISPGQACVFYATDSFGDKVFGGGWIHRTFNKNLST